MKTMTVRNIPPELDQAIPHGPPLRCAVHSAVARVPARPTPPAGGPVGYLQPTSRTRATPPASHMRRHELQQPTLARGPTFAGPGMPGPASRATPDPPDGPM
jgi:hypothetical protein